MTRVLLAEAVWMAGATRYTNRYRNGWTAAAAVARCDLPMALLSPCLILEIELSDLTTSVKTSQNPDMHS